MNLFFGMVASSINFFVDLGEKIDFMGLNLFQISFIFFLFVTMVRFLFPILFSGAGDVGAIISGGQVDVVTFRDTSIADHTPLETGAIPLYGEKRDALGSAVWDD